MTTNQAMGWTVLLILTLMVCGCTREVVRYASIPLPMPALSELPTATGAELQCLSDDTYARLVQREALIKQDRDVCRAVICTTQPECEAEQ